MNRIFLFVFALLVCFSGQVFAQKNIEAKYELISRTSNGTSSKDYTLYANAKQSVYELNKRESNKTATEVDGVIKIQSNHYSRNELYVDFESGNIDLLFLLEDEVIQAVDTPPKLDWSISEESKNIGVYRAIKAETSFRGREYIAWFTPEIPIVAGPWKLHGLPGLILEAVDKEGMFEWHLLSLTYPTTFDAKLLEINTEKVNQKVSLKEAIKMNYETAVKNNKLNNARMGSSSKNLLGFQAKVIKSEFVVKRDSELEREYEWE